MLLHLRIPGHVAAHGAVPASHDITRKPVRPPKSFLDWALWKQDDMGCGTMRCFVGMWLWVRACHQTEHFRHDLPIEGTEGLSLHDRFFRTHHANDCFYVCYTFP